MANMELITSVTVGSGGAASVTLPASGTIPQTYTDLKIVYSIRSDNTNPSNTIDVAFNGNTSNFTNKYLQAPGPASGVNFGRYSGVQNSSSETANTFSNGEIYIPNYTSSNYKSYSADGVYENNSSSGYGIIMVADLWANTAPITSIGISGYAGNFLENSTFYLYGISAVPASPKATGGIVSQDATYWYHTFPFSSTFTPTTALSADYLVVAGGGGGGSVNATSDGGNGTGGGGAGGYRTSIGGSALSLTAQAYTITVGAGGAGGAAQTYAKGTSGSNSVFSTITSTGGGGGGAGNASTGLVDGISGGSGGGGGAYSGTGGSASPSGQGNAGGAGVSTSPYRGGGGGGAGSAGAAGASSGNGGDGLQLTSFANATFTGVNGYYAGGGGGGVYSTASNPPGNGGLGGGGIGGLGAGTNSAGGAGGNGLVNLGAGGGGGGSGTSASASGGAGGSGGSGLVIIRYAK